MGGMHSPRGCRLGDCVYVVVAVIAVLAYNHGDIVIYSNFFQHLKYFRLNTNLSSRLCFLHFLQFVPLKNGPPKPQCKQMATIMTMAIGFNELLDKFSSFQWERYPWVMAGRKYYRKSQVSSGARCRIQIELQQLM